MGGIAGRFRSHLITCRVFSLFLSFSLSFRYVVPFAFRVFHLRPSRGCGLNIVLPTANHRGHPAVASSVCIGEIGSHFKSQKSWTITKNLQIGKAWQKNLSRRKKKLGAAALDSFTITTSNHSCQEIIIHSSLTSIIS